MPLLLVPVCFRALCGIAVLLLVFIFLALSLCSTASSACQLRNLLNGLRNTVKKPKRTRKQKKGGKEKYKRKNKKKGHASDSYSFSGLPTYSSTTPPGHSSASCSSELYRGSRHHHTGSGLLPLRPPSPSCSQERGFSHLVLDVASLVLQLFHCLYCGLIHLYRHHYYSHQLSSSEHYREQHCDPHSLPYHQSHPIAMPPKPPTGRTKATALSASEDRGYRPSSTKVSTVRHVARKSSAASPVKGRASPRKQSAVTASPKPAVGSNSPGSKPLPGTLGATHSRTASSASLQRVMGSPLPQNTLTAPQSMGPIHTRWDAGLGSGRGSGAFTRQTSESSFTIRSPRAVHQSTSTPSFTHHISPAAAAASRKQSDALTDTPSRGLHLHITSVVNDTDYPELLEDNSAESSLNSSFCSRSPRSARKPLTAAPRFISLLQDREGFTYNAANENRAASQFFEEGSLVIAESSNTSLTAITAAPAHASKGAVASSSGLPLHPSGSAALPPHPAADSSLPPMVDLNPDPKRRLQVIQEILARIDAISGAAPLGPGLREGSAFNATSRARSEPAPPSTTLQCRRLSLYDAFFLDRQKKKWLVDDLILAKCFEFVRLMGYEHPQLKKDRAKLLVGSLWSSSAAIPSPVVENNDHLPSAVDGYVRRHRLSHKPVCLAERTETRTTFIPYEEALRWVKAREYVLATVLLVIAAAAHSGSSKFTSEDISSQPPCIPTNTHPIFWMAQHILESYPQWGDFSVFATLWETQVKLIFTPCSASRQRVIRVKDLVFSSDLEGGNLAHVERAPEQQGNQTYLLWLEPDLNSDKRIWFRFSVSGALEGHVLRFKLLNAAPHWKLYHINKMMPVWRDGLTQVEWTSVDQCSFRLYNNDSDGELFFSIMPRNSTETIQVAFCAPYTYSDLLCHITHWHYLVSQAPSADVRFEECVLGYTPEGRKQHLLIITSPSSALCRMQAVGMSTTVTKKAEGSRSIHVNPNAGLNSAFSNAHIRSPFTSFSEGKKVILISGRVHPGEITASHGLHGLVTYLLSSDVGARRLRDHFVFLVVPMLNPDGVSRGHSRMDQYGVNLNRSYNKPNAIKEPTVFHLKKLFEALTRTYRERFMMYIDFHSHASQSTSFMFGNHLPAAVNHWNKAFPRLVQLHAPTLFAFSVCRFTKGHMSAKDGASRVLFGTSLIHSYTIELPHFTDRRMFTESVEDMAKGIYRVHHHDYVGPAPIKWSKPPPASNANSRRASAKAGIDSARSGRDSARRSASTPNEGSQLQPIAIASVLQQSATVGIACMQALLDYTNLSAETPGGVSRALDNFGGMAEILNGAKPPVTAKKKGKKKK